MGFNLNKSFQSCGPTLIKSTAFCLPTHVSFSAQTPSRRGVNHKVNLLRIVLISTGFLLKSSRRKKPITNLCPYWTELASVCPRSWIKRPRGGFVAVMEHRAMMKCMRTVNENPQWPQLWPQETDTCPQHTGHTALYTSAQQLESQRKRRISCPANTSWELRGPTTVFTAHKDNGKGRCINAGREIGFILVYLAKPGYCLWETCGTAKQSKTCLRTFCWVNGTLPQHFRLWYK